jgi:hypothetical protein
VTFVVCVESGLYESMAILMVESLRRFGGRFAAAPVLAITPRLGPGLARSTRRRLGELDVTCVRTWHVRRAWFSFYPKVWALEDAERLATTELVVYVDSDILFLAEPTACLLPSGAVVAACARDDGIVGVSGPGDRYEPAWQRACAAVGLAVDELPWVDPEDGSPRIRFYLNAGIVVVRRGADVTRRWLACTEALFRRRVDFGTWREQFHEQVALGLTVVRFGLPYRLLPWSHNYGIDSSFPDALESDELARVVVLHYHDQLRPEHWSQTVERLREVHPEAGAWLATRGPVVDPASSVSKALRRWLAFVRHWRRRLYRLPDWLVRRRLGRVPPGDLLS